MINLATITHEQLILRDEYRTGLFVMKKAAGALGVGAILSKVVKLTAKSVTSGEGTDGANTGTELLVPDATTPVLHGHQKGDYIVECVAAATATPTDAVFSVTAPDGTELGTFDVDTTGVTWANQIKFAIADVATAEDDVAFAAGDAFTVTVADEGGGELEEWDGTNKPFGLLFHEVKNVANATQKVTVFLEGEFNADLIEGADDAFDDLRALGIYLTHPVDGDKYPIEED